MFHAASVNPVVPIDAPTRSDRRTTPNRSRIVPKLMIATAASAIRMGAQVYQEETASRAESALAATSVQPWTVRRFVARSLRSDLPGTARLPMGWIGGTSARNRRALGRLIYPPGAVVHRMDLSLPPAPHDVLTIYDIVAWKFPDETAPPPFAAEEARRAAAVVCISEHTAADAQELLGVGNPQVVHLGVDPRFLDAEPLPEAVLGDLGIRRPYVLHAGGSSERKNLRALAEAWPTVRQAHPDTDLVLAGPPHPRRTELFIDRPGAHLIGRVPDDVMPGLLAAASAVVVPSLYEGFGLPVLEAMATRTPVVVANTSSLVEVAGDAGIMVDPTATGIADGLLSALTGGADIEELRTRGRARVNEYTWDRCAREHARVWADVAGSL